ncbi:MAG: fumarylacetoacetate hydrolase family protein [Candidatus Helarchaeota archaeon]
MKICRFMKGNQVKYGILVNNHIWDFVIETFEVKEFKNIHEFIEEFYRYEGEILDKINNKRFNGLIELSSVELLSPIKKPSKIICLGRNYLDHAEETGDKLPKEPMLFSKASSAIIGPNENIIIPTLRKKGKFVPIKFTDYEAELAVVIGRKMKKIDIEDVPNYIFGYTILNDVSARIQQQKDKQFFRSKSFDTFAPMGPWIVTHDEIGDPMNLRIQSLINGEVRQDSNTGKMNFNVYEILSYISEGITLYPGDIIGTGTPAGVGVAMNPPNPLKPGDTIEIKIEKIGSLINKIISE